MPGVLIFSARMGAGHDGAAHELARRARERGVDAEVVDFLDAFPRPLARLWEWFYVLQLRRWPESYESSYQLFYRYRRLWKPFVRFERALAGRRSMRWIRDASPDVVVSTYSFATLVLGELRREGRITVPVVAFLTDFGVHPRTVHPDVDLHLAVHSCAADDARRWVPGDVRAPGPAVSAAYTSRRRGRDEARRSLGIAEDALVVLVVCGSWGIGARIPETVRALVEHGGFTVITACGRDDALRRTLDASAAGLALGWTDQLDAYVAAADVVVENAGGLSSLEALAAGVPVVSFDPIPGHGRDNVRVMVRAGVTSAPADHAALCAEIERLAGDPVDRAARLRTVEKMFVSDPIDDVLAIAGLRRTR